MDSMTIDSMKQRFEAGLKRAREAGASGAKFGFSRSESISASMVNNRLKSAGTTRGSSYGINVIVDRKMGSVRGNDLGDFEHTPRRASTLRPRPTAPRLLRSHAMKSSPRSAPSTKAFAPMTRTCLSNPAGADRLANR